MGLTVSVYTHTTLLTADVLTRYLQGKALLDDEYDTLLAQAADADRAEEADHKVEREWREAEWARMIGKNYGRMPWSRYSATFGPRVREMREQLDSAIRDTSAAGVSVQMSPEQVETMHSWARGDQIAAVRKSMASVPENLAVHAACRERRREAVPAPLLAPEPEVLHAATGDGTWTLVLGVVCVFVALVLIVKAW